MPTDAQLAMQAQAGDREAFSTLARRLEPRLFAVLRRTLADDESARDTCQETLLRAWLRIGGLRDPERVGPWVHRIALNLCRDRGRSRRGRAAAEVPLDQSKAVELAAPEPDPAELASRTVLEVRLAAALAELSLEQRAAILLREIEGYTSVEIAAITGVPAATVRSRIFYGLKALRQLLPKHGVTTAELGPEGRVP